MSNTTVNATYRIETPMDPRAAAEIMAGEQSSGTFVAVPGETEALTARHRASVLDVQILETVDQPTLPGSAPPAKAYHRAQVKIAYPIDNLGPHLTTLVTTLMGNLYELQPFSGLKLLDVELPDEWRGAFAMPAFGIAGTRRLAGVHDRPILGTIIKPSVGLNPTETAALVGQLAEAGLDFIKDDELQADAPHCPFDERVRQVMQAVDRAADRTGRKVMVAFNISDSIEHMLRHHDAVVQAGGTCVMVSLHSVGFAAVEHLRRHAALPIHGHRNGWGLFTRCPQLGVDYRAWQKLWRLAGVDHLHVNGLCSKFWEPDDSVVDSIGACLEGIFEPSDAAMPVVSSGQWGGQAPATFERTATTDLMYVAGGGIVAHPMGPAAGVEAIRQAWDAAVNRIDLNTHAQTHPPLAASIQKFGQTQKASEENRA